VVRRGYEPGIYFDYQCCQKQVEGCPDNQFKKFNSFEEAYNYYKSKIYLNNRTRI
ncbi:RNase H1/viroplasmin domain-containing protein ASCRUDRAFT_54014, partial [Ascoidea rubescens DSM 1968]